VLFVLAVVALGIYLLDQGAKYLIVKNLVAGQQVNVLGTFLQFHFVQNSGAAFSIGTGMTWVFSIVAAAVAVFIILYARRIRSYGWGILFGLLLGGTLGNLSDRLFRQPRFGEGHVVDFIQVFGFPAIFNIADSAICISMALFIILTIRGVGLDGKRVTRRATVSEAAVSEAAASDSTTTLSTDAGTAGSKPRAADSEK
jgi:signal peptidase II